MSLRNLIEFDYIGCYRYTKNETSDGTSIFQIELDVQPKELNKELTPEKIGKIKKFEENEFLDLTDGIEHFYDDGTNEKMETILQFIEQMDSDEMNLRKRINSEFICNRGLLKMIAETVSFSRLGDLEFRAVRRKNVIFMCFKSYDDAYNERYKCLSHMAGKFETLMTINNGENEEEKNGRVSYKSKIKAVNRLEIRKTWKRLSVFSSSEIDAMDQNQNFIEIKLLRSGRKHYTWMKHRALGCFLQSYLANINILLFGYRCPDPSVEAKFKEEEIDRCKVHQTELVRRDNVFYNPKLVDNAIVYLYDVLLKIKNMLPDNEMAINVQRVKQQLVYTTIYAKDCEFVSDEFLDKFE